jgi:hypothetical protein
MYTTGETAHINMIYFTNAAVKNVNASMLTRVW